MAQSEAVSGGVSGRSCRRSCPNGIDWHQWSTCADWEKREPGRWKYGNSSLHARWWSVYEHNNGININNARVIDGREVRDQADVRVNRGRRRRERKVGRHSRGRPVRSIRKVLCKFGQREHGQALPGTGIRPLDRDLTAPRGTQDQKSRQ